MNIIGISGKKRSGKDTLAKFITEVYPKVEIKKFASSLKSICAILTGRPVSDFYNHSKYEEILPFYNMNLRQFQQYVGTDVFRKNFSKDIWINCLFQQYQENDFWVISDVRFKNEANAIKENGGYLFRVNRPDLVSTDNHSSETDLDDFDGWDLVFQNTGSLHDFEKFGKDKINEFIEKIT